MANGVKYRNGLCLGDDGSLVYGGTSGPVSQGISSANPRPGSGPNHYRIGFGSNDIWYFNQAQVFQYSRDAPSDGVFVQHCFSVEDLGAMDELTFTIKCDGTSSQEGVLVAHILPDGSVTIYLYTSVTTSQGSIGSAPPGTIQSGTWHCLSMFAKFDQAAGEVAVAVDGAEIVRQSGDTWIGNGNPDVPWGVIVEIDSTNPVLGNPNVDIQDIWHEDGVADLRAPIYFKGGLPDTDTVATATGVGDAVNLWANVDDDPLSPSAADYNDFDDVGDETRHATTLTGLTGTILEVSLVAGASDPSGSSDLIPTITEGGTTTDGPNMALTATALTKYRQNLTTNPRTAAAWTPAEAEAVEIGARRDS